MTTVTIDIRNIASKTYPDDKVVFRSPEIRENPAGGMVSTADEVVPLVDGQGTVNLTPGPVTVFIQCRGVADNRSKNGTVPDSGTVNLVDIIAGDLTYTPAVVSAAVQARNEARAAADRAEAGADRVGTAEQVGQWASTASTAASTATSAASSATSSKTAAATSATAANTSKTAAATSATNAASSASAAATSATNAASSASAAAGSASTASTAATTATTAKDNAASSASAAAGSASTAGTAATTATNKAVEASNSADRAEAATSGKADLVGGKIPSSQIPDIALTKPFVVSLGADVLTLDAQEGDIAVVTTNGDNSQGTWILGDGAPSNPTSWIRLTTPEQYVPVTSVNGKIGSVVLGYADVGAAASSHTHTLASLGAAAATHTHTSAQISDATPSATPNRVIKRGENGEIAVTTPTYNSHPTPKSYVDSGLSDAYTAMYARPALFSGVGNPPSTIAGAVAGDWWLNITTMELHQITGV